MPVENVLEQPGFEWKLIPWPQSQIGNRKAEIKRPAVNHLCIFVRQMTSKVRSIERPMCCRRFCTHLVIPQQMVVVEIHVTTVKIKEHIHEKKLHLLVCA